jgi:hypothetical protein
MVAVWNYASSRKNETAIIIQSKLKKEVIKMSTWFSNHNNVKTIESLEFYGGLYHVYMSFDREYFVAPNSPQKPYDLVSIDDLFQAFE